MSRLVVLGSCGAWPEAGRACSGFVLEHAGFRVVLDLGYGTLPRLLSVLDSSVGDGVDAVVITHRHPDHAADLHGLFRARWFGRRGAPPVPLFAPAGVLDLMAAMDDDGSPSLDAFRAVFDWHPLPAEAYEVGPFRLRSWRLPHWVPNAGVRFEADGLVVAYTGDTGPDPSLVELAADADLFVAEASDRYQQPGVPQPPAGEPWLHLDAPAAASFATRANARRLLLTHFWPGNDRDRTAAAARDGFSGEVLVASEGLEVALP